MSPNLQALAEFGGEAIVPAGYSDKGAKYYRRPMDSSDDRPVSVLQHEPM